MEKPIAALELGSKKLKLVIGYELNNKVYVRYTLVKPYGEQIIEAGNILDFNKLVDIVHELTSFVDPSVKKRLSISDVVLALPPYGLEVMKTRQTTGTTSEEGKITSFDIKNLYSIIRNCNDNKSSGKRDALVDIVPYTFVLDQGRSFVNAPIGETSRTLQVVANVHTLPPHIYQDFRTVLQKGNISVKRNIVSPFAAVELICSEIDAPANFFLVDIGSSTTTVSLVGSKRLFSSTHFQWGGDNITQRIVACFNINEADAEKYKITYGIDKRVMNFKAPVCVTTDNEGNQIKHSIEELNTIIKSELDIFTREFNNAINALSDASNAPGARTLPVIFTGGGSRLFGLLDYILPKIQSDNVSIFTPKSLGARNGTFTNCLGIILVCAKYPTMFDDTHQKVGNLMREPIFNENK